MSKLELDNLVKIRKLKEEPPSRPEYDGMLAAAKTRLRDAQNEDLDSDSQFDLAYGAAHRLAAATRCAYCRAISAAPTPSPSSF